MPSSADDVKARTDIVEIISSYISLKKAGANFKARCPFHNEKSPSFMVSVPKQIWHCFGCGKGGDVFAFLMEREGMEFVEALKMLADRAGIKLPSYNAAEKSERVKLLEIIKEAERSFMATLEGKGGDTARAYCERRGLKEDDRTLFGIGYAPPTWDGLLKHLGKHFREQDLYAAGLLVQKERSTRFYDRFRNRIMIPLRDVHGVTVGFTGRILEDASDEARAMAGEAKYMNTPESMVFKKGMIVYGLDRAKNAIREAGYAVIVEGNMDVITCHSAGMRNVVAPCGTALTVDQLKLIGRFAKELRFSFDQDAAGQTAIGRGIALARQEGFRIKVIQIPPEGGKDPDECIRKDPALWNTAVLGSIDAMEYWWIRATASFEPTPIGFSALTERLMPEIALLPTLVEQDHWISRLARTIRVDPRILWETLKRRGKPQAETHGRASASPSSSPSSSHNKRLSDRTLALLLENPERLGAIMHELSPTMLPEGTMRTLYEVLLEWYTRQEDRATHTFSAWLERKNTPELQTLADTLGLLANNEEMGDTMAREQELRHCVQSLRQDYLQKRRTDLVGAMSQAEAEGKRDVIAKLSQEFQELSGL